MATTFQRYSENWEEELRQLVKNLEKCRKQTATVEENNKRLLRVVEKVVSHLSEYYRVKSVATQKNVLSVMAVPWTTSIERSLHWINGWRPTNAGQIIYAEAIRLENKKDILNRLYTRANLGNLSPIQFRSIAFAHCEADRTQDRLYADLFSWQKDVSRAMINMEEDVDFNEKLLERLVDIQQSADELRVKTIEDIVEALTPPQAVDFLLIATRLHLGLRVFGLMHDSDE
ncbi:DOG1 domain-containing protein [Heracleum sosnowskyi]|uniref:DOG1 domain-containing protein n=1 Tax=Heracleum sosnowskyi TaxID=360622 RepID=A0AAD8J4D0_9APIA|nr:DOG1 domain-containing protein [Heracleum sosnowskyi]